MHLTPCQIHLKRSTLAHLCLASVTECFLHWTWSSPAGSRCFIAQFVFGSVLFFSFVCLVEYHTMRFYWFLLLWIKCWEHRPPLSRMRMLSRSDSSDAADKCLSVLLSCFGSLRSLRKCYRENCTGLSFCHLDFMLSSHLGSVVWDQKNSASSMLISSHNLCFSIQHVFHVSNVKGCTGVMVMCQ